MGFMLHIGSLSRILSRCEGTPFIESTGVPVWHCSKAPDSSVSSSSPLLERHLTLVDI